MKLTIEGYHGLTNEELRFRERFSTVERSTIPTDFKPEIIIEPVRFSEQSIHQLDLNRAEKFWQFLRNLIGCEKHKLHHDFFIYIDRLSVGRYTNDVYAYELKFVSRLDTRLRDKIKIHPDTYVRYKTSQKGQWKYGAIKKALDSYLGSSCRAQEYYGLNSADAACVFQGSNGSTHIELSQIGFESSLLGTFVPKGIFDW